MDPETSAGLDPATNPAPGAPAATPPAPVAAPTGSAPTNGAAPALPTQMPNLEDDPAWSGMPSWIKALRTENATRRTSEKALSDKVSELERAKLSAEELLKADLTKATTETIPSLNKTIQSLQVQVAAGAKGIVDPEAAALMLDWDSVGKGTTIDAALDALVAKKPYLIAAAAAPAASTGAPASTTSPAAPGGGAGLRVWTEREIGAMSVDEYETNAADIQLAASQGRVKRG